MSCSVAVNCTGFPHDCPLSAPDSDVAGIGVVWGFGVTSFITVALSAPMALLGLIDLIAEKAPRLKWIQERLHPSTKQQHDGWMDNLVHIIIGLSDQQLVTGLAILIVGFSKHCSMSARHFWVVFDLGWFSSVTHLASLPALNIYLQDYPRWRDLRVALMLSNLGFLIAAAILTFGNYDPAAHDCPIQCMFDRFQTSEFPLSGIHITQMVFLTLAFIWALIHLYAPLEIWEVRHKMIVDRGFRTDGTDLLGLRNFIETKRSRLSVISSHSATMEILDDAVHFRHVRSKWFNWIARFHRENEDSTAYLIFRWILLMLLAPPSAIVWLNLASMWSMGAARLLDDRAWSVEAENEWGFGQVLPLLLLVLPFFTVSEVAQEYIRKRKFDSVEIDKLTTTHDPDARSDTTLLISQTRGDSTAHVQLTNVPLDDVVSSSSSSGRPPLVARHSSQPNYSHTSSVSSDPALPAKKRSSTTPLHFTDDAAAQPPSLSPPPSTSAAFPRTAKFSDLSSPGTPSPGSPFSPMHMPPSASRAHKVAGGAAYDSLPADEEDEPAEHWNETGHESDHEGLLAAAGEGRRPVEPRDLTSS